MLKNFFIIGLFLASLGFQSCSSATSQSSNNAVKNPNSEVKSERSQLPKDEIPNQQNVDFKGVSFTYNPQIFGEVKTEEVAEYPLEAADFKPDGVEPQHRLFTFDLKTGFSEMHLAVYPIDDFPRMYAVNKLSVKAMEKEIRDLKKVLKDKNFRVQNEIPFLPFYDASQAFQQKVKHYSFQGGRGIFFLTYWEIEISFPNNRQLRYIFEGLTDDEKYYVLAEMPLKVTFLPDEASEEYEGYKTPWGKFDDKAEMKRFAAVNEKIARRLENLSQNEFNPNLDQLEKIISSLKVEK